MKQIKARILENKRLSRDFYKMRVASPHLGNNTKPGQFVEVRCTDRVEPLLRRPFSAHRILKNGIEILYKVVGKGTEALAGRKPGELLDIIGPLGSGFKYPIPNTQYTILIAGGMGVAPLVALAEGLAKNKPLVIIGAKTKSHVLCEKEFKALGCDVRVATEDGSKGKKGLATDLLNTLLQTPNPKLPTTIYACGPNAMLKEVAKIAKAKRIRCQVSLEEYMACGVGVCLGCPVKVRKTSTQYSILNTQYEYKMICKDGPVFDAEEIIW